jgi:hypothetical protein
MSWNKRNDRNSMHGATIKAVIIVTDFTARFLTIRDACVIFLSSLLD